MVNIKLCNKFPKAERKPSNTHESEEREDERSRNYIFIAFYWITFLLSLGCCFVVGEGNPRSNRSTSSS